MRRCRGRLATAHWRRAATGAFLNVTEYDAAFGQVVRGQFERDFVTGEDTDEVLFHLAGRIGDQLVAVFQVHTEALVWQHFIDNAIHFN